MELRHGAPPEEDETLEHPNCVFQILKRHFAPYTPEVVEQVCGVPREKLVQVAETLCRNSGRERTSAIVYAVGWTQHTHGVQNIRAASIIQLLLGNIGRPGGGILALRGHANIQGSTDIPTLYDILPGYIPMPHPNAADDLDEYIEKNGPKTGAWGSLRSYFVSLMKAWWGEAANEETDFGLDFLPRINGDHSHYPMMLRMIDGETKGFIVRTEPRRRVGQRRRAAGAGEPRLARRPRLPADRVPPSGTTRRRSRWATRGPRRSAPRCSSCPPRPIPRRTARSPTRSDCCSGISRPSSRRETAARTHWFTHLGQRVRRLARRLDGPQRTGRSRSCTWDYPLQGPHGEPDPETVLQEINGRKADGSFVANTRS